MLEQIKAFANKCLRSATVWLAAGLQVLGWVLDVAPTIAADPQFNQQLATLLHGEPSVLAGYAKLCSILIFAARARGLVKSLPST
jgi:hypothetical protein